MLPVAVVLSSCVLIALELLTGPAGIDPMIVKTIRLPRMIVAILVGGGLAVSGATFQSILSNPLADPYIMGSASGAAIGVIVSELTGLRALTPLFAFVFAAIAGGAAIGISRKVGGSFTAGGLVLAGFSVNVLASSLVIAYFYISGKDSQSLMSFLFGYLGENDYRIIGAAAAGVLIPSYILYRLWWILDASSLGEEKFSSLGFNAFKTHAWVAALATLIVSVIVSIAGIVGFAGLVAPNAARFIVGPSHKRLLPASFIAGALFLMAGDITGKIIFSPYELPAGIVTSIIGIPVFVKIILLRQKR